MIKADGNNPRSLTVGDDVRSAASWDAQHITGHIMEIEGDRAHVFWYGIDTASWCKLKDLKRAAAGSS